MKKISLWLVVFCLYIGVKAQTERPKVGLVLSGGGAKGVAHIGVLKAMEEAGLTPDYITGTSMGSIMGGLYSIGYSADEIAELVTNIDWGEVLTNKISLDKVTFEEKAYYGRYLIDLYLKDKSLIFPSGVIEGQALMDIFSELTRPVHNIHDFNKFPIPFACVATNIVTGEPVVLRSGSLASAMRASMAIPTVFTPIKIDDNLLVDGGLVRNMPVPEIVEMGADIVIGVYVSSDFSPEEELTSFVSILTQSALIGGIFDTREQLEKCNILVTPDLKDFSTGSFFSSEEILDKGMEAGRQYVEIFRKLADSLKQIGPLHEIIKPEIRESYVFDSIAIEGNVFIEDEFIIGKLDFEAGKEISIENLKTKLNLMFGTQYFEKIHYEILKGENGYTLIIMVNERPRTHVRFSYQYSSENKGGIITNATFRNLVLNNSRLIFETELSAYPIVMMDYFKYVGNKQNFAMSLSGKYINTDLPLYDSLGISNNIFGSNYYEGALKIQSTSLRNSTFGLKMNWSLTKLHAKITEESYRNVNKISYDNTQFSFFYDHNSLNDRYFPTRGTKANVTLSATTNTHGTITLFDAEFDIKDLDDLMQTNTIHTLKAEVKPIIPISSKFAIITKARIRISNIRDNTLNLNEFDYVGGFTPDLVHATEYYGAGSKEFRAGNYFYYRIGGQFEPRRNLFLQADLNFLSTEYPIKWIYPDADIGKLGMRKSRFAYAAKVGLRTPLGPVSFGVAKDHFKKELAASFMVGFIY